MAKTDFRDHANANTALRSDSEACEPKTKTVRVAKPIFKTARLFINQTSIVRVTSRSREREGDQKHAIIYRLQVYSLTQSQWQTITNLPK